MKLDSPRHTPHVSKRNFWSISIDLLNIDREMDQRLEEAQPYSRFIK